MKRLPKIYQNSIDKKIKNNKVVSYVSNDMDRNNEVVYTDISKTLDEIFSGYGYSYNIPVIIKTYTKTYDTSLVTRTENNVVTLDNDLIPIEQIVSITRKNPLD